MKYGSLYDPFTGKETISDTGKLLFLQSPAYCNMIRKMVVGITGKHSLMVSILPVSHPELGFTNGERILINTLHPLFAHEPIEDITVYCLALATHESLHPLYSCFQCIADAAQKRPSESENYVQARRSILNILEDARIERIGRFKFPGVAYAIEQLNEFLFEKASEMESAKDIEVFMQWLLDFVSVDKTRGELPENLQPIWEKVKPLAVKAKYSDTCSKCYYFAKKILKLIAPLIPPDDPFDDRRQKPQNVSGNNCDVDAETGETPDGGEACQSPNGKQQMKGSKGQGENQKNQSEGNQDKQDGQANSQPDSSAGQQGKGNQNQDDGSSGGKQEKTEAELKAEAEEISQMLRNSLNSSFREHLQDRSDDAADISRMQNLQHKVGKGYKVVSRYGNYSFLQSYETIKSSVVPVINNLKRGLKNILNYNVDEMSRYLHSGRIDAKSLSRMPSGAICGKRIEKSDEADLNITVLVDMSGSMSGIPIQYAKAACTVLYEVCRELHIPITVMGFQSGQQTQISYFADTALKGKFSYTGIIAMNAGGSTPLNSALNYLPMHLKKIKEEDKLVIVITDGMPDESCEICKKTVNRLSEVAKVYGLAIGSGRDVLSQIFGTKYIGVDSLDKLPRELCKIIEKNLFRR